MKSEWIVHRRWFWYAVAKCVYQDFLGAGYKFARNENGRVVRFWSYKKAWEYAEKRNELKAASVKQ